MAHYRIKHLTKYTYTNQVTDSANQIMLYPVDDALQEVKDHKIIITSNPVVEIFTDYYGNRKGMFTVIKPHDELSITSEIEVVTSPVELPAEDVPAEEQWKNLRMMCSQFPYMDFLSAEAFNATDGLKSEVSRILDESNRPLEVSKVLADFVYNNFKYKKGITTVETSIDEVWDLKAGVCQDFAHILLLMLRMAGIPARYVSGYICPINHELRGEGATHAWVDAYIPYYGWLGLDPTNNCIVSDRHVRLAIGRNFSDCTPVKGTYKGSAEHTLEVSVSIENGTEKPKTDFELVPSFSYHVKNPALEGNSYRRFLEMQQQQ